MSTYSSSIQVLNGTHDITSMVQFDSTFNIEMVLTKEKGQFSFNVKAPLAPTLPANIPKIGDEIYVYYTINGTKKLVFGGTLVTSDPIVDGQQGGAVLLYRMIAADWGFLFDSKLVKKNYAGIDPQDLVKDLVANFCPSGFTTNHVQRGNFLISTMVFNYQYPTKCLEAVAKQIGWEWYIDPSKDIHFYFAEGQAATNPDVETAPFDIDETTGNIEWPSLNIKQDITNMKNSVYVVGGKYAKDYVVNPNANATPPQYSPVDVYTSVAGQYVYPLAYPYSQSTMTVTLNGTGQSIGTDQQTDPSLVEVLYNDYGRFVRFTSDPGSGKKIVVQGEAQIPILAHVSDPTSIAAYGELQDGIVDSTILSIQEAQERAQAEIDMFGDPVYTVKFRTISSLANQLFIGQQITLNSTKFGISGKILVIKRIHCLARTKFQLEYHVEALGSDNVSFNDIMMTLLQKDMAQSTTPDSTVVEDLIPLDESITFTETVSIIKGTPPYVWGPSAVPAQSAEGGATYASFGYGSSAYAAGIPYADDAAQSTSPEIRWGFFTWS